MIDGDEKVSERKAEGWRRWFRLFFSRGGVPKLGGSRSGACGSDLGGSAYLVGDGLEDLVGADLGVSDSLGGDRALDRELRMWGCDGRAVGDRSAWGWRSLPMVVRCEGKEMFRPRRDHALVAGIRGANGIPSPGIITAKVPAKHSRRVRRVHTLAARGTARSRSAFRGANLLNIAEINDAGRMCFGTHLGLRELGALEGGGLEGAGGAGLGGHDAGGEDSGGGDEGGHVS